jgi:hypothetical protein
MHRYITSYLASLLLALFLAGCGDQDPGAENGDSDAGPRTERLFPFQTGNTWTYRVTGADGVTSKVHTIGEQEAVGGTGPNAAELAFRVVTTKGTDGTDETVSWQVALGDRVVRYREQAFSAGSGALELEEHWAPHKLRVPESADQTRAGASFLEEYSETKLPVGGAPTTSIVGERWDVLSENESVTVPAGTFEAVVLRKSGGQAQKSYWYAPGVGKVKETGSQTEELVSYDLATP